MISKEYFNGYQISDIQVIDIAAINAKEWGSVSACRRIQHIPQSNLQRMKTQTVQQSFATQFLHVELVDGRTRIFVALETRFLTSLLLWIFICDRVETLSSGGLTPHGSVKAVVLMVLKNKFIRCPANVPHRTSPRKERLNVPTF